MTPSEIIASGNPYFVYGDQYIETKYWPNKRCDCKGRGHYGMLAPKGTQTNDMKSIGPNSLCICRSGKKYKKCCQQRVERLQKGGYRILICHCVGEAFMGLNPFLEDMRKELAEQWNITTPTTPMGLGSNPTGPTSTPTIDPTSELSPSSLIQDSSTAEPTSTTLTQP